MLSFLLFIIACKANAAPILHSLPGASHTLTLVFDGDASHATPAWGTEAQRLEVWQRVSEKYSPFNVDVTTAPGGLRIIVGGNGAWTGQTLGGIYQGNVGYVFPDNLATVANVGEAASHEAGHVYGLNHQSLYPGGFQFVAYNPGDALRAPIMGVSYYAQRGVWWSGQSSAYTLLEANGNLYGPEQDDIAILTAALGLAADDHPSPSPLVGTVTGIIGTLDDRDAFTFHAGGPTSLIADVAAMGPMLDLRLDLYDAGGGLVASADTASLGERIDVTLADGDYLAVVGSHGGYGDLGSYSLAVTTVPEPHLLLIIALVLALIHRPRRQSRPRPSWSGVSRMPSMRTNKPARALRAASSRLGASMYISPASSSSVNGSRLCPLTRNRMGAILHAVGGN